MKKNPLTTSGICQFIMFKNKRRGNNTTKCTEKNSLAFSYSYASYFLMLAKLLYMSGLNMMVPILNNEQ